MKKRIIISVGIAGVVITSIFIMLQTNKEKKQPMGFFEICWEDVNDYTITEMENGIFSVELIAPDYKELLEKIAENDEEIAVTDTMLTNLTQENKDVLKNYMFSVQTDDIKAIKEGYFNEIGNDICELIIETYTENNRREAN